jgi:hypothetical protein
VLRRWRSWSRVLGKLKRVTTVGIPKYVWDNTRPHRFCAPLVDSTTPASRARSPPPRGPARRLQRRMSGGIARTARASGLELQPGAGRRPDGRQPQRQQHRWIAAVCGVRLRWKCKGHRRLRTALNCQNRAEDRVPNPRKSKTAWRCPRQRSRPLGAEGSERGRRRRTRPPGLSCSRLVHGTVRKGLRRAGTTTGGEAAHALVNPQPLDRRSWHRNGTQTTHNPTAPGWNRCLLSGPVGQVRAGENERASAAVSRSWGCWDRPGRSSRSAWRRSERLARWPASRWLRSAPRMIAQARVVGWRAWLSLYSSTTTLAPSVAYCSSRRIHWYSSAGDRSRAGRKSGLRATNTGSRGGEAGWPLRWRAAATARWRTASGLRVGMPRPWRVKALRSDGQVVPSSTAAALTLPSRSASA